MTLTDYNLQDVAALAFYRMLKNRIGNGPITITDDNFKYMASEAAQEFVKLLDGPSEVIQT